MAVPDKIRGHMKEKQYFAAAKLVMSNLSLIRQPEFMNIHALSDIRDFISDCKQVVTSVL
jgi:hypothetical protein